MTVSGTTVLRQIRQSVHSISSTPDKVGVDDWAFRKDKQGVLADCTQLVDLERHQAIELLPERSAVTLAHWLQEHPGVQVITRGHANEYIDGANRGAPDAVQVTDRFYLVQNVREMVHHLLERLQSVLASATIPKQSTPRSAPSARHNDD